MSKLMQNPVFHELKKHASFFIKDKIKTARLAVTDVTEEEMYVRIYMIYIYLSIDFELTMRFGFVQFENWQKKSREVRSG